MANPDIDALDAVMRTDLCAVIRKCFETVPVVRSICTTGILMR